MWPGRILPNWWPSFLRPPCSSVMDDNSLTLRCQPPLPLLKLPPAYYNRREEEGAPGASILLASRSQLFRLMSEQMVDDGTGRERGEALESVEG